MRAVLASERIQVQNLLMDMVEEEPGAVVVGQAENAANALALVRNLRPDVAIIDSNLPYSVGMDRLALSRMSGLDTAQTICRTIPGIRVVIINNLDAQLLPELGLNQGSQAFFSRERIGGNTAFKLQKLSHEVMLSETPVFANIEVKLWPNRKQENKQITDGVIATGTVSIAGGLHLIDTIWFAPYGALLVLAGVVKLGFGLLRRITARLWHWKG